MLNKWTPPDSSTLKINTGVAFVEGKISIGILIRNHLGVPLLAKVVPRYGSFLVDFGELGIKKGYILGLPFTERFLIRDDGFSVDFGELLGIKKAIFQGYLS